MARLRGAVAASHLLLAIFLAAEMTLSHARVARKLTTPTASATRIFMASLPMNISVSTPPELASDGKAYMSGLQDITVVFSRPVIALGSDFDSATVINKVPFRLSCKWPGKTRWVTTSIARYDPDEPWPSDLACELLWNTALKTYDGVKLQLGDVRPRRALAGPTLAVSGVSVVSDLADNVTAGQWSSGAFMEGDKAPEVPPDGRVQLYFSYNINLKVLQSALQLLEGHSLYGNVTSPSPKLAFTVRPCTSAAPWAAGATSTSSLDVNATCADVEVGPSLKPDTWYTLRLPAGTKYNSVSGPLPGNLDSWFAGIRPFRLPFTRPITEPGREPDFYGALRRWDMWLPHSLAPGVTPAALASSLSVCEVVVSAASKGQAAPTPTCRAVPFSLKLVGRMVARLEVPAAQPGKIYRVYAAASSAVRDGFGQPLQASATEFGMSYVPYQFAAPSIGSSSLFVLEAGADSLSDWPYITRAPPPQANGWPAGGYPRNISSYTIDVTRDSSVIGLLSYIPRMNGYYGDNPSDLLGRPTSSLPVNKSLTTPGSAAGWTRVAMPLGSAPLQVVYACCTPVYEWYAVPSSHVVLRTSLSLVVVQAGPILVAWVTDAALGGGSGAAVAGADVSIYSLMYSGYYTGRRELPYKVTQCTTNSQGFCSTQLPADQQNGNRLAALARAISPSSGAVRSALLPTAGWAQSPDPVPSHVASVVVDRRVVEPGDSVKITGFVQEVSPAGLSLPPEGWVVLEVSPDFDASRSGPLAAAKLSGITGTFHVELAVPPSARMDSYTISVHLLSPSPASDADQPPPDLSDPDRLSSSAFLTSVPIVVSSPRPPTAELRLTTDPWVAPNGAARVNVTAVSYIGASVGGSPVAVRWRVVGLLSGILNMVTDADGAASGVIDLAAAVAAAAAAGESVDPSSLVGATLAIVAEWIGPTRERIMQSGSINIAAGPARVALSPSLRTDAPGIPFTLSVSLTSSATGASLDGLPVTVTLRPAATAASATAASATPATSAAAVAAAAPAVACAAPLTCSGLLSGDRWASSPCRLALPCVGHYVIEACADVPYDDGGASSTSAITPTPTPTTPATVRVCGTLPLGRNATEWGADPLSEHPEPILELDKSGGYRLGDQPRLWLEVPFSAARLLVVWGTTYGVRTQVFNQLPAGTGFSATLPPLGSECATGCSLTAVLDVPRRGAADLPAAALPPATELPVASLFDPRAPHTTTLTAEIRVVPDNELAVKVEVAAAAAAGGAGGGRGGGVTAVKDSSGESLVVVEPGASAQITVDVGAIATDGPVEITVYGVDKAFLDLMPYDLPRPQQEMLFRIWSSMGVNSLDAYRVAPGAVRAVYDKMLARLGLDPWLPISTGVQPLGGLDPVDLADVDFLAAHTSFITAGGGYNWDDSYFDRGQSGFGPMVPGMMMRSPPPSGMQGPGAEITDGVADAGNGDGGAGSADAGAGAADGLRRSVDFVVTPLFAHAIAGAGSGSGSSGGRAVFNFTAPQNLGAFVIRAFAAAGSSAKYGSAEGKLVVRRSLSLTPSVPPFVRVGDTFEAGAVVTLGSVGPSAPTSVAVGLTLRDASGASLRVVGPATKTVTFTAAGGLQQEVRFSFRAVAVGTTVLVISAADGSPGGGRDSLELEIPVEGQQGDVWVATSFALAANASSPSAPPGWVEGMVLPGAVPGSGGLTLTAGVGYLPAIGAMYDNLAVSDSWRTEPYAQPAVLWATLPAVLSYYGQTASDAQAAAVARGVSDLTALTDNYFGLQWSLPSRWSSWYPDRTDVHLNTWALLVVNTHAAPPAAAPAGAGALPPALLAASLAPVWRSALERQLVRDVVQARTAKYTYDSWNTLAWVRLALGARWVPSAGANADPTALTTLSLNTTLAAYRSNKTRWQFDRQTRVVLSLVLLSLGRSNPEPGLVSSTLAEVTAALRVQGRTAYVAAGPGSASASSLEDQALGLLLLLRSGTTHQLVPKLAAYVASPTSSSGGGVVYFYAPWSAQALALAALAEYDTARGSSKPSLVLEADVNGLTVLQASFRVNKTRPVSNTTAWEDMPPPPRGKPRELDFAVSGTGEVTVAASLHFVPSALPAFPTYRGLFVDLALQLVDPLTGRPTGPRVGAVPLGSVVALSLQLTSPDDLGAVTLSVMMPGGLEPLDPNIVSDAGSSCFTDWLGSWSWRSFYPRWWWWPVCPAQETRPSLVTFSYAALRAGTTTATIKAVAATAGTFVVPPVRASVDEQPEVMGMTAAGAVTVCAGCAAATPAPPPRAPKPCPGDCSDKGLCNLQTGVCACDAGFTGLDCAAPVAVA